MEGMQPACRCGFVLGKISLSLRFSSGSMICKGALSSWLGVQTDTNLLALLLLLLARHLLPDVGRHDGGVRLLAALDAAPQHGVHGDGGGHRVGRLAVPGLGPHGHVFGVEAEELADVDEGVVAGGAVDVGHLLAVGVDGVAGDGGAGVVRGEDGVPRHEEGAVLWTCNRY